MIHKIYGGHMKRFCFTLILFSLLSILQSCDHKSLTTPQPANNEFIILAGAPKGFTAVNIITAKSKSIPAVQELGGRMYLLFYSSLPTFNKKVVEGMFIPDTNYYLSLRDTIFRVTKHLRDTTVATVGN